MNADGIKAIVVITLYLLPTIWAYVVKNRSRASSVMFVNLFFGWTVIGWFIAMFMANAGGSEK